MSETEKKASHAKAQKKAIERMRRLAKKMRKKAETLTIEGRYEEAWEYYELAGYLKGAADIFEDLV